MNVGMDERVNSLLERTKIELTKDSAVAIICLEDDIFEKKNTVELLRKGELVAIYKGDKSKSYDPEKFLIKTKGEIE